MVILNVIITIFGYKSDMLDNHIGGHNGGHIGFRRDLYIENYILMASLCRAWSKTYT